MKSDISGCHKIDHENTFKIFNVKTRDVFSIIVQYLRSKDKIP